MAGGMTGGGRTAGRRDEKDAAGGMNTKARLAREPQGLIKLRLPQDVDVNMTLAQIKTTLQRHHGPAQVLLYLPDGRTLRTDSDLWGEISEPLRLQLTAILGSGNVKME